MENLSGDFFASQDPAEGRRLCGNVPAQAKDGGGRGPDNDPALLHLSRSERIFWEAAPMRPKFWANLGPQAALIVALFGFAWAASSYFSAGPAPLGEKRPADSGAAQQEMAGRQELTSAVQKMAAEIRSLQSSVETLRAGQSQAAKIGVALSGVNGRLDSVKFETSAAIAAMAGKLERAQREPEAKLSQVIDRLDRLERKLATPVAAEAPPAAAGSNSKTAQIAAYPGRPGTEDGEGVRRPHLLTNWVVRDVYDGFALLENHRGITIEVAPGEYIPGAGRVRSIERRGPGWIVLTSQGLV
ncbi:MAG: hypothetical protein J2P49_03170, partial [Methylocapsa sp.]|nr:hypothetical protein [Methylocapsa sp.]